MYLWFWHDERIFDFELILSDTNRKPTTPQEDVRNNDAFDLMPQSFA